ncbi:MAG: hypothetical protein MUE68_13385 [Bacteroidetes bacterium]|nr:hypothetical protein [Bacteroidota bacterium]
MVRGQLAHVVLSRPALASGPADTTALLVSGDAVSQLMRGLPPVGPLDILDTVGLANLARQERWYVTMKFAAPPSAGVPDTMLRVDTLLTYDGTTYNVRIVSTRTRLSSRSITVPAGTFTAVPFAYKIIADAFVFGPVRLAETYDTVFVAQNAWIVKHVRASAPLPIEPLGIDIPGSYVRGFVKVLTSKTVVSVEEWGDEVEPWRGGGMEYGLGEPYPNPFNPLTSVDFRLANSSQVRISFVDLLGRTVEVLADGEFGAGMHRVRWNAGTRASGTYLVIADFRLSSGEYHRLTRKVMLVR